MDEFVKMLYEIFGEENVIIMEGDTLEDTIPDMLSEKYEDRFKAEYTQLLIRYESLQAKYRLFLQGVVEFSCPRKIIERQLSIMKLYLEVLKERAFTEGISISTTDGKRG